MKCDEANNIFPPSLKLGPKLQSVNYKQSYVGIYMATFADATLPNPGETEDRGIMHTDTHPDRCEPALPGCSQSECSGRVCPQDQQRIQLCTEKDNTN